jgi:hypothetical protein
MAAFQAGDISRSLNALSGENAFSASNNFNLTRQICRVNWNYAALQPGGVGLPDSRSACAFLRLNSTISGQILFTKMHDAIDWPFYIRQLWCRLATAIGLI